MVGVFASFNQYQRGAACYPVLNQRCVSTMLSSEVVKASIKVFKDHSVKLKANFGKGVK